MKKVTLLKTAAAGFTVDKLGDLRAQIDRLKKEAKELETILWNHGERIVEGNTLNATLVESERDITDWKKIAMDLGASRQKIKANTRSFKVKAVRTTARKE